MNSQEIILAALKAGTPLNPKNRTFRSLRYLAALAGIEEGQAQELVLGDLAANVEVKPSLKHGWLVKLRSEEAKATAAALAGKVEAALAPPPEEIEGTEEEVILDAAYPEEDCDEKNPHDQTCILKKEMVGGEEG